MNQDQIKELLLKIRIPKEDFSVILTGKASRKVNGFYRPEERTLYLHNKNLKSDQELLYTAIHEYAHHLQFTESAMAMVSGSRCHSQSFWALFHALLDEAEEKEVYRSLFRTDSELMELAARLKKSYLTDNAKLMIDFGRELLSAYQLCLKKGVRFDDYADRCLGIPRHTAKSLIKLSSTGLDPELGLENIKALSRIRDREQLAEAEKALREGKSSDFVKEEYLKKPHQKNVSEEERLQEEKNRLERTIRNLERRLEEINRRLESPV